jgi:hypothetical protein
MYYSCNPHLVLLDPVDYPIAVGKYFANQIVAKFGNNSTDRGKIYQRRGFLKNGAERPRLRTPLSLVRCIQRSC